MLTNTGNGEKQTSKQVSA